MEMGLGLRNFKVQYNIEYVFYKKEFDLNKRCLPTTISTKYFLIV